MSITDCVSLRDAYAYICQSTVHDGDEVMPRGYVTRELQGVTIALTDLPNAMPIGCGRDLKPEIGAAEALLLCGGIASPSLLISTSPAFKRFLDGGQLHGAYGPRVRGQLPRVVERLQRDPDSRQAFVTLWDPAYDQDDTRDLPCTTTFNFHIRNGALVMHSHMRSQDVFLGLPYDCWFFGQLGMTVARALGLPPEDTTLIHHVDSFHAYERNFEAITKLHAYDPDKVAGAEMNLPAGGVFGFGNGDGPFDIRDLMSRARSIYNLEQVADSSASELWYTHYLSQFDRLTARENFTS